MATLLFEIGTEELPSWYLPQGRAALEALVAERLSGAGLARAELRSFATPRRLAVQITGLTGSSPPREELKRGPAAAVAFDASGAPSRAAVGFARANGVDAGELFSQETDKGTYLFVRKQVGGERAEVLLPPLLSSLVRDLSAPRKMRWGEVETPFLRPVAWLVALLDDKLLPVSAAGLEAGRATRGHRFLSRGALELPHADDYEGILERAFVIADPEKRRAATLRAAEAAAAAQGLELLGDPSLLAEVANLLEYPVAILGRFDERYLTLPDEVLSTTMIHHQRFFPTRTLGADTGGEEKGEAQRGALAPYFVGLANNDVPDASVVRRGYEGALNPRLFDARFFWDADRSRSLSQHAWGLSGIGFHKGLGTVADKVARTHVAATSLAQLVGLTSAEQGALNGALPVFKADLNTQMVDELPELEGVIGCAYALAEGYPAAVAETLEHGVRPVVSGGALPTSRAGAVLSLADRLDKLLGFFALSQRPSGSADPFGLRRDALAVARILSSQGWRTELGAFVRTAAQGYVGEKPRLSEAVTEKVVEEVIVFIWDRVTGLLEHEGVRPTLVRAVTADNPPVITAARRAHLLRALYREPEFAQLLQLYKRAANLAKQLSEHVEIDPARFESPYEAPLYEAIPPAKAALSELLATVRAELAPWDLGTGPAREVGALGGLSGVLALKPPLDAFLDNVHVMVESEAVRRNRLALLGEVSGALSELGRLEVLEGLSS